MSEAVPSATARVPDCLRPLKWNERVQAGDFVEDGRQGFELWEGPSGFRADAFIKQIFRRQSPRQAKSKKAS
jgi:hypothetical protein